MMDLNLYDVLRRVVEKKQPKSYLEIGVQEGNSLRTVLRADANRNITSLVLCDTWGGEFGGTSRNSHLHIHGVLTQEKFAGEVRFLDGDSKILIYDLESTFDLILVDGDHSEQGCTIDMENAWDKLNPGGCMIVDDLIHPAHKYIYDVCMRFTGLHSDTVDVVDLFTEKLNGAAVFHKKGSK
jgi:predicted O-methyltransferase YrrM